MARYRYASISSGLGFSAAYPRSAASNPSNLLRGSSYRVSADRNPFEPVFGLLLPFALLVYKQKGLPFMVPPAQEQTSEMTCCGCKSKSSNRTRRRG